MKAKTTPAKRSPRNSKAAVPPPAAGTHITGCSFTNIPPGDEVIAAVAAIARAAERNAEALCAAARILKGPDALLRIGF